MTEDFFTNTPADAAIFESHRLHDDPPEPDLDEPEDFELEQDEPTEDQIFEHELDLYLQEQELPPEAR